MAKHRDSGIILLSAARPRGRPSAQRGAPPWSSLRPWERGPCTRRPACVAPRLWRDSSRTTIEGDDVHVGHGAETHMVCAMLPPIHYQKCHSSEGGLSLVRHLAAWTVSGDE